MSEENHEALFGGPLGAKRQMFIASGNAIHMVDAEHIGEGLWVYAQPWNPRQIGGGLFSLHVHETEDDAKAERRMNWRVSEMFAKHIASIEPPEMGEKFWLGYRQKRMQAFRDELGIDLNLPGDGSPLEGTEG